MRLALAVAVAAALACAPRPERALACTCAVDDAVAMVAYADVVFLGKSDTAWPEAAACAPRAAGVARTWFDVQTVFKGDVAARARVRSMPAEPCGEAFEPDTPYVVYARRQGPPFGAATFDQLVDVLASSDGSHPFDPLWARSAAMPIGGYATSRCAGSFAYAGAGIARAAALGPGHAPVPDAVATAAGERIATAAAAAGWTDDAVATVAAAARAVGRPSGAPGSPAVADARRLPAVPSAPSGIAPRAWSSAPKAAAPPRTERGPRLDVSVALGALLGAALVSRLRRRPSPIGGVPGRLPRRGRDDWPPM